MTDEILQLKPNFRGVGLNFKALLRRWRKLPCNPIDITAARFIELFDQHGVAVTQIPRLLPAINLAQLASPAHLLIALTDEVLEAASALFGNRREWLEGTSHRIYPHRYCYKSPRRFFDELHSLAPASMNLPVRAFTPDKDFDYRKSSS